MTTRTEQRTTGRDSTTSRSMLSRVTSFARAELTMLLRNKTAITNVVAMPLLMLGILASMGGLRGAEGSLGNSVLVAGIVIAIAYVVYYNLVTTYVARRESYVLKRLRTGPVSDLGVLAATSVPSIVLAILQIAVVVIALIAFGRAPTMTNIVAVVLAVVLGIAAFAALALLSTGFTRTAETAQITTLPVVMITMGLSGMFFPLHVLPDTLATVAHLTPGAAMVDLLNLGLSGIDRFGDPVTGAQLWTAMLMPSAVLLVWTALGVAYVRRQFPWEPRR